MGVFTILEFVATISGIACVYLQTKEKIIAWPLGIVSVAISAYLFFQSNLLSDFALHIIFIGLNIFGWYSWSQKDDNLEDMTPILHFRKSDYFLYALLTIVGTFSIGYLMKTYAGADLPYFDAFTTAGSLVAQFLLAKKYLQNWIFWIIVDVVAVNIYLYKGLYMIAFLFFVYLIICVKGYIDWKRHSSQTLKAT